MLVRVAGKKDRILDNCMIRNFIFHRVVPKVQNHSMQMDVRLFEKCLQFINNRYEVIRIEDILSTGASERGHKPYATLTFDDGYADNITYAAPILEKYHCKASFFVVTKCVEENIPVWGFHLEWLIMHTRVDAIAQDHLPANLRLNKFPADPAQRMGWFKKLKTWLKTIPVDAKEVVFMDLCKQMNDVEVPLMMMGWQDLASLKRAGHYIGSHTHTHNALTLIENEAAIKEELSLPRELIHKNLGYLPVSIAYPFGLYNDRIKKLSAEAGYQVGIASDKHQLYYKNRQDCFEIPRIALCNESWFKTKLRITNRIEQIKSIVPNSFISRLSQE